MHCQSKQSFSAPVRSSSMPWYCDSSRLPSIAFESDPWGSRSITRVLYPLPESSAERFRAVVVFAVPPLVLAMVIVIVFIAVPFSDF